jgi:hypothetical protein
MDRIHSRDEIGFITIMDFLLPKSMKKLQRNYKGSKVYGRYPSVAI